MLQIKKIAQEFEKTLSKNKDKHQGKKAVIITGNPELVNENPWATVFYQQLQDILTSVGYDVVTDPGEPYTEPPPADLWVGHSRGIDRLQFAPSETRTVAIGSPGEPGVLNHPLDDASPGNALGPAHYALTPEMIQALQE